MTMPETAKSFSTNLAFISNSYTNSLYTNQAIESHNEAKREDAERKAELKKSLNSLITDVNRKNHQNSLISAQNKAQSNTSLDKLQQQLIAQNKVQNKVQNKQTSWTDITKNGNLPKSIEKQIAKWNTQQSQGSSISTKQAQAAYDTLKSLNNKQMLTALTKANPDYLTKMQQKLPHNLKQALNNRMSQIVKYVPELPQQKNAQNSGTMESRLKSQLANILSPEKKLAFLKQQPQHLQTDFAKKQGDALSRVLNFMPPEKTDNYLKQLPPEIQESVQTHINDNKLVDETKTEETLNSPKNLRTEEIEETLMTLSPEEQVEFLEELNPEQIEELYQKNPDLLNQLLTQMPDKLQQSIANMAAQEAKNSQTEATSKSKTSASDESRSEDSQDTQASNFSEPDSSNQVNENTNIKKNNDDQQEGGSSKENNRFDFSFQSNGFASEDGLEDFSEEIAIGLSEISNQIQQSGIFNHQAQHSENNQPVASKQSDLKVAFEKLANKLVARMSLINTDYQSGTQTLALKLNNSAFNGMEIFITKSDGGWHITFLTQDSDSFQFMSEKTAELQAFLESKLDTSPEGGSRQHIEIDVKESDPEEEQGIKVDEAHQALFQNPQMPLTSLSI